MTIIENPFKSFWMGGFECTDQLNFYGNRVDLLNETVHFKLIHEDYELLKTLNINTVREGIRWSKVEYEPYQYDFSDVKKMILAGKACGIQQVWDICHFGYPDDLSPLHPHFTRRFVALCEAFAAFYNDIAPEQTLIVTPINEVSFISWLGGDAAATAPYCRHNGWEVKYGLMRAYIAGVKALKAFDPSIRIMTTEPLINVVPPLNATREQIDKARWEHELQYQSVDMLCGRICPELGGSPDCLDMLGFNFYYDNQWVAGSHQVLGWNDKHLDARMRSLSELMKEAHVRYDVPVVLTETSHPLEDRPLWIKMVADETSKLIQDGVPLWGVCYYPIIDRPDWDHLHHWHHSGIWDTDPSGDISVRILHEPSANALRKGQIQIEKMVENAGSNKFVYIRKNPEVVTAEQEASLV
ncbi:amine oxidase [Dyadobacter sediminis]|uniref:amine oxidase n=1 Tax=Dyadobacter sediminis TaxID=1493691 RepID=UPI0019B285D9|nr:amine oxidase [Dyadobacter sediminis]GGB84834.1 beta-glucosidase [Dyadobacter sediminis]